MSRLDCDVLVVGAGPTGATLALLLAKNGVRTVLVDKEPDIYPLPRAAHIDHEIVRIFQELGLADAIVATCRTSPRYDFLTAGGEILLRFEGLDRIGPGGWPLANMIHQPLIEKALRSAIAVTNGVVLRTSSSFEAFESKDGEVRSRINTANGPAIITSRYLVGADGARSAVRDAAVIGVEDLNFDEPWLVIDAVVHDASCLPHVNLQICDPERPTTCVLMGAGRHRWEFMLKPGESLEQVLDGGFITKLLDRWNVTEAATLERKAVYRFHATIAKHWRKGQVLLAGDAAHQMPPFAGQGLCSGVRDAANIAWKLAAIVSNRAPDRLLDSYQVEREPHVRAIIDLAMMMGRTVCITDPEAAARRDAQMLAARESGTVAASISYPPIEDGCILKGSPGTGSYFVQPASGPPVQRLDDVIGRGAWLIARGAGAIRSKPRVPLRAISLDEAPLSPFRAHLDSWLCAHGADAVLVRPDRYVFGTGAAQALYDAWVERIS